MRERNKRRGKREAELEQFDRQIGKLKALARRAKANAAAGHGEGVGYYDQQLDSAGDETAKPGEFPGDA